LSATVEQCLQPLGGAAASSRAAVSESDRERRQRARFAFRRPERRRTRQQALEDVDPAQDRPPVLPGEMPRADRRLGGLDLAGDVAALDEALVRALEARERAERLDVQPREALPVREPGLAFALLDRQRGDAFGERLNAPLRDHRRCMGERHPHRVRPVAGVEIEAGGALHGAVGLEQLGSASAQGRQLVRRHLGAQPIEQELAEEGVVAVDRLTGVAAGDEEMPAVAGVEQAPDFGGR
jgi:hypothetical protein